jgi:hypothetical protein
MFVGDALMSLFCLVYTCSSARRCNGCDPIWTGILAVISYQYATAFTILTSLSVISLAKNGEPMGYDPIKPQYAIRGGYDVKNPRDSVALPFDALCPGISCKDKDQKSKEAADICSPSASSTIVRKHI